MKQHANRRPSIVIALTLFTLIANASLFAQPESSQDPDALAREVSRLYSERRFAEAKPIAERVVKARRSSLGESDITTGEAIRALAYVELGLGRRSAARRLLRDAIKIYLNFPKLPNDSREELGAMLERLGFLQFEDNDDSGAVESFAAAVEQRERLYGSDSLHTAQAIWSLAGVQYARREFKKAKVSYLRVFQIRLKQLGEDAWDSEDAKVRYVCAATKSGDTDELAGMFPETKDRARYLKERLGFINAGVVNEKAIKLETPEFPVSARHAVPTGNVSVSVTIAEDGTVVFACALNGNSVFWETSERAAYRSVFSPATLNGKPAKVIGIIDYGFRY